MKVNSFYEKTITLDKKKKLEHPTKEDLKLVLEIIRSDVELIRYFYGKNEQGALSVGWLELLDGAGEFAGLENVNEISGRIKAFYIVDCAAKKPETVLGIIKKVKVKDAWIQRKMLDAILAMPEDIAVQGMPIVLDYLGERNIKIWHFIGEPAAELMIKLVKSHMEEAFKIAWLLVDAWGAGEVSALFDMTAKFEEYHYEELIFKYYNKLFEIDAERATDILVKILDRYIKDASKKQNYDASSTFYIGLENLEEIDRTQAGVLAILVKGICEGGREVIKRQPEKVKGLLDYLERLQKDIFYRIEMYLLRFVPKGEETERIRKIILNKKYFEKSGYEYEYKLLLRDMFEELDSVTIDTFVKWVKEKKKSEKRRKEIKEWCEKHDEPEPDFEKMENRERAEELYLVREKFTELYEQYKKEAGVKDDSTLAPRPRIGEVRHVSPMEGTPLSLEEMGKRTCDAVLDYILETKNYEGKKKAEEWQDTIYALQSTFKEDVKKRTLEYIKCDIEKLAKIPAEFLTSFFYGAREGSFSKDGWKPLVELAALIVRGKNKEEYRSCFHAILNALRGGFSREKDRIEFDGTMARQFWSIVNTLVHFPLEDMSSFGEERDPMQISCNQIPGQALELTVLLAVVCKNKLKRYWENNLRAEMRKCWEFILNEIKEPGVNCMLGIEFARIYWLDSEWFEQNLDRILSEELWDETWGTYVSWGRPSPACFKVLVEKSKYGRAAELLGSGYEYKYEFRKKPGEGLAEHLMIGYFNGWICFEDEVFKQFFEKAPAELRGKAARFMTTGFRKVNEEGGKEKEKIAERMREYWSKRLAAIKDNPEENKDEAIELAGWVDDSVLQAKETLELLDQSLDLSGGKIGKMRGARDFVEGVSKLGRGNELLALQCLKKAAADENMHIPWSHIQDPLVKFLEMIDELPENVRSVGRKVADLYGRYNPEKFHGVWEKLNVIRANEG